MPRNVYYQGPVYPYLLSLAGIPRPGAVQAVRLAQLLLAAVASGALAAAAAAVLLRAGRGPVLSACAGVAAGVLHGLYGPLVFLDGFLYRDGPVAHVSALLLAIPLLAERPAGAVRAAGLGLLAGAGGASQADGTPARPPRRRGPRPARREGGLARESGGGVPRGAPPRAVAPRRPERRRRGAALRLRHAPARRHPVGQRTGSGRLGQRVAAPDEGPARGAGLDARGRGPDRGDVEGEAPRARRARRTQARERLQPGGDRRQRELRLLPRPPARSLAPSAVRLSPRAWPGRPRPCEATGPLPAGRGVPRGGGGARAARGVRPGLHDDEVPQRRRGAARARDGASGRPRLRGSPAAAGSRHGRSARRGGDPVRPVFPSVPRAGATGPLGGRDRRRDACGVPGLTRSRRRRDPPLPRGGGGRHGPREGPARDEPVAFGRTERNAHRAGGIAPPERRYTRRPR